MQYNAKSFSQLLQGQWEITRILTSNNVEIANAKGMAQFNLYKNILLYSETLTVHHHDGKTHDSNKKYNYVLEDNKLTKYFVERDGEGMFYELSFKIQDGVQIADGHHKCNDDDYHAKYSNISEGHFTLSYIISGPSKNEVITTEYTKIGGDASGIEDNIE